MRRSCQRVFLRVTIYPVILRLFHLCLNPGIVYEFLLTVRDYVFDSQFEQNDYLARVFTLNMVN